MPQFKRLGLYPIKERPEKSPIDSKSSDTLSDSDMVVKSPTEKNTNYKNFKTLKVANLCTFSLPELDDSEFGIETPSTSLEMLNDNLGSKQSTIKPNSSSNMSVFTHLVLNSTFYYTILDLIINLSERHQKNAKLNLSNDATLLRSSFVLDGVSVDSQTKKKRSAMSKSGKELELQLSCVTGLIDDFRLKDSETYSCTPVKIPNDDPKRINLINHKGILKAVLNVCPHQGSSLTTGTVIDIEDMGIVWGSGIVCSLHGWVFSLDSGQCDNSRFVIDVFEVKTVEDQVWVSFKPINDDVPGPRRDFGGVELK
ncbi:hypothetical protein HDV02_004211 [Globomyces sp. JEL0801]|nr:hypothetical protein HDV02_004211 [Globomyces sp. JEL0801]